MAHRRAVPRRWRGVWLLVPLALALDAAAALVLNSRSLPLRLVVPEAVLLAAPVVVYGALAFFALRTWPPAWRLAAATALLGMHAGLVALHTVAYVVLWSFPAPAALRLAHRWSPLVPLLQLLWVPLLALPLAIEIDGRRRPVPPRRAPMRTPTVAAAAYAAQAGLQARPQPEPRVRAKAARPEVAPGAVTGAIAAPVDPAPPAPPAVPSRVAPASPPDAAVPVIAETVSAVVEASRVVEVSTEPAAPASASAPSAPAPTWFDELIETAARNVPPEEPRSAPARDASVIEDATPIQRPEPVAERREPEAPPGPLESVAPVPETEVASSEPLELAPWAPLSPADAPPGDLEHRPSPAPPSETAVSSMSVAEAARRVASPPLDLDLVARAFAPYGPLLSRDREVQVDWIPGPGVPVICVAPRDMSRDRVTGLAARMLTALDPGSASGAAEPVRRLSLRNSEGVIVLTPLDGAVLATASRRPGAVALLEALSARLTPAAGERAASGQAQDARSVAAVAGPSGVNVETPAATLEVFAPAEIAAGAVGELTGRLLAVLAADSGGLEALPDLALSLHAHRVVVHPVDPASHPPRFVVVVGARESPGLLGRQAERAARAFRLAS